MIPPPPGHSHSACTTTVGSSSSRYVACSVKPTAVSHAIIVSASAKVMVCQSLVSAAVMTVSLPRRAAPWSWRNGNSSRSQVLGGQPASSAHSRARWRLVGVPARGRHLGQRPAPQAPPREASNRATRWYSFGASPVSCRTSVPSRRRL